VVFAHFDSAAAGGIEEPLLTRSCY